MSNTITAYFKGRVGVAESVYQNDYGIVMAFDSIDLPAHFDCYFSVPGSDTSIPAVGADNMVVIPNSVLGNSGSMAAHIPLHTGANDSEVEYVAYFKVIGRARPEDDGTPTQMTAIEQALALLQNPITNIEQIVNEALAFTGETFDEMQADLEEWKDDTEESLDTWKDGVDADVATCLHAVGSPLVASTVAGMTDNTKIYVYTGSETGYTAGNWYYWNGSAWTSGGVYNSTALNTDTTLLVSGAAADAKVTGEKLTDLKSAFIDLTKCKVERNTNLSSSDGSRIDNASNFTAVTTFIPVLSGTEVRLKTSGFAFRVCKYSAPLASTFTGSTGSSFQTSNYTVTEDCYIRISFRFDPSSSPCPTESDFRNNIMVVIPRGKVENQKLYNLINYPFVYRNMLIMGAKENKTYDSSEFYSLTERIKVEPKQIYYLHWSCENRSEAADLNLPAVRIFAMDSSDKCIKVGGNNTSATQYNFYNCGLATAGAEEYAVLMFPSSVKYVQIQYDSTVIDDSDITFESSIWETSYLTQQTWDIESDIDFVKTGQYISTKNNEIFVDQFLDVAESYYNRKDDEDNYILHYGKSHTVLGPSYDGNGAIDCSCFVGLVIRGIPFDETEYNEVPSDYDANPDYKWSLNPYSYELPKINYQSQISEVRTAAQLANMYYLMGRQVWIDSHLASLMRGDILFFARKSDETEEYIQPRRFEKISHVAIVYNKETAPIDATWDTDQYPYMHTLIEVVDVPGAVRFYALEKHSGEYENGPDTLVMVARPALGTITPMDVNTNNITIGDVTLTLNIDGSVTWNR